MVMSLNAISMPRLGNNLRFLIEPEAPSHHVTLMPPPWKNCLLLISDRSPTRLLSQEAHLATPAAFRSLDNSPPIPAPRPVHEILSAWDALPLLTSGDKEPFRS